MKNHFFISMLAAVALLGGLTACNGKLDKAPRADQVPENAVRITASIGNPFAATRSMPLGTEEEQTKFKEGDEILVKTDYSEQRATYRFDGTAWKPKDGKYLLWKYDWPESFRAFYTVESGLQAVDGAPYVFPTDQSSIDKIAKADIMSADLNPAKTKEVLHFTMHRNTTRLIVEIAGFNSEFPADAKVENVEFHNKSNASAPQVTYTPYADGEGKAGSTYTVLVPWDAANHTVSLTVGGKAMTAKLQDYSYDNGKSYTYRLTVGKEKLEVGEVTVADWTGREVIPGGEAKAN
ncbi:fimbrillin family protein [Porphyromonas endodontalis]